MTEHPDVSILTLNCREASRLASESLDRELGRRERWALQIHNFICKGCRQFARQIKLIRDMILVMPISLRKQWFEDAAKLSSERIARIKRALSSAQEPNEQD